jgi:hypothetical protein
VSECVCVCVCIYIYTYIHIFVYIHIHLHTYTHISSDENGSKLVYYVLCTGQVTKSHLAALILELMPPRPMVDFCPIWISYSGVYTLILSAPGWSGGLVYTASTSVTGHTKKISFCAYHEAKLFRKHMHHLVVGGLGLKTCIVKKQTAYTKKSPQNLEFECIKIT